MPSRLNSIILAIDMERVAGVDPCNVDNLFSMWTIFSKCAESLENGRRLENLSWRLWNRETLCCGNTATSTISIRNSRRRGSESLPAEDMPELSSSVVSAPSDDELPEQRSGAVGIENNNITRPCIVSSEFSSRGREKHMTPVHLAKIMENMSSRSFTEELKAQCILRRKMSTMPADCVSAAMTELSKSSDEGSEARSTHSVVRGFSPSRISSSYRSSTNVAVPSAAAAPPAATKKKAAKKIIVVPVPSPAPAQKKKPVFFFSSSPSSDGSVDDSYHSFKHSGNDKKTAFRDEVATRTYDDDDSDDDVSESAIDDDDLEWESSSESGSSSYDDGALFKRVESRPNLLASRRSLLSTMLHEPERAAQLANAASRSTPVLRRFNSPREPPFAMPVREDEQIPGSKPIRRINTALHPLALSPRTTRRNMLATELTESLRKHLLWERQQKNTTASAHLKRRHTAADVTKLVDYPQGRSKGHTSKTNSWNNPFDGTQYEYHAAGW